MSNRFYGVSTLAATDLLPIHNLVCDTSIIRIELETLLGKALHKLLVVE